MAFCDIECVDNLVRQGDSSPGPGRFRPDEVKAVTGSVLQRLTHMHQLGMQMDVTPPQAKYLALAHAEHDRKHPSCLEPMTFDRFQEAQGFGCVVGADLVAAESRWIDSSDRARADELPTFGDRQCPSEQCVKPTDASGGEVLQLLLIERCHLIRTQLVDLDLAQRRGDVEPNCLPVSVQGRRPDGGRGDLGEVALQPGRQSGCTVWSKPALLCVRY